ncbi:hypothetical protein BJ508DRAFT_336842, partial [Ascobolus immersus RN42]
PERNRAPSPSRSSSHKNGAKKKVTWKQAVSQRLYRVRPSKSTRVATKHRKSNSKRQRDEEDEGEDPTDAEDEAPHDQAQHRKKRQKKSPAPVPKDKPVTPYQRRRENEKTGPKRRPLSLPKQSSVLEEYRKMERRLSRTKKKNSDDDGGAQLRKEYPYKLRDLTAYLGLKRPIDVRRMKVAFGNDLKTINRFQFHFAWSKYTEDSRAAIAFSLQLKYYKDPKHPWAKDKVKCRKVCSGLAEDRRRQYRERKLREGEWNSALQRRMEASANTISCLYDEPLVLEDGERYDWPATDSEPDDHADFASDDEPVDESEPATHSTSPAKPHTSHNPRKTKVHRDPDPDTEQRPDDSEDANFHRDFQRELEEQDELRDEVVDEDHVDEALGSDDETVDEEQVGGGSEAEDEYVDGDASDQEEPAVEDDEDEIEPSIDIRFADNIDDGRERVADYASRGRKKVTFEDDTSRRSYSSSPTASRPLDDGLDSNGSEDDGGFTGFDDGGGRGLEVYPSEDDDGEEEDKRGNNGRDSGADNGSDSSAADNDTYTPSTPSTATIPPEAHRGVADPVKSGYRTTSSRRRDGGGMRSDSDLYFGSKESRQNPETQRKNAGSDPIVPSRQRFRAPPPAAGKIHRTPTSNETMSFLQSMTGGRLKVMRTPSPPIVSTSSSTLGSIHVMPRPRSSRPPVAPVVDQIQSRRSPNRDTSRMKRPSTKRKETAPATQSKFKGDLYARPSDPPSFSPPVQLSQRSNRQRKLSVEGKRVAINEYKAGKKAQAKRASQASKARTDATGRLLRDLHKKPQVDSDHDDDHRIVNSDLLSGDLLQDESDSERKRKRSGTTGRNARRGTAKR